MSLYLACEVCDATDPRWSLTRRGDAALSWACEGHLSQVADGLQRDFEVTELAVRDHRKALKWARIGRALDEIAGGT